MTFRGSVEGAHIYAVVEHGPIYNKPAHYGAGHGHVTENVLAQLRRDLPYPTSTPLFPSSSVIVLPEHRSLCLSMVTYNFTPGNLPPRMFLVRSLPHPYFGVLLRLYVGLQSSTKLGHKPSGLSSGCSGAFTVSRRLFAFAPNARPRNTDNPTSDSGCP